MIHARQTFTMLKMIAIGCLWLYCSFADISQAQAQDNAVSQNAVVNESAKKVGVIGSKAMVVSAHPEASKVGASILQKGGTAVDAAIAVQFALAVAYPVAGNIGGGGFMVLRLANGKTNTLDYREAGPKKAFRDMFLDSTGQVIKGLSMAGHKASGVPGVVDGMVAAHKKYGKLSWKALVQPAIDLARKGVVLTEREARGLNSVSASVRLHNPEKSYFLKSAADTTQKWSAGELLVQEDLAQTLERIRDKGRAGFYSGKTADFLVAEMNRGANGTAGIITQEDLRDYRAKWRTPLAGTYKDYTIIGMPPPSSGGVGVLQMLKMLASQPLKEWGHNAEKTAHFMIEAERRYFAERAEYLGDPDFYKVPVKGLLNTAYIAERMKSINPDKATPSAEVTHGSRNLVQQYESMETTHFSIVDEKGNAVSVTTTLNGGYGSRVVVGGAGFFMNNEMDDFSVKPGVPNMFGALGGEANAIAPGKRMLSSMTPTIVEHKGKLLMDVGSPGGTTIITSVMQTILNVLEHGMGMQEAVNAKRFHHQHLPDQVLAEKDAFTDDVRKALEHKGHRFTDIAAMGKVDAILVLPKKKSEPKKLEGGADPRGDDTAVGY